MRASGKVIVHEGYVSRRKASKAARAADGEAPRPARPEVASTMQAYCDLHRHAAVSCALLDQPQVALRFWWRTPSPARALDDQVELQACRSDAIRESIETMPAQPLFDGRWRAVLALLGLDLDMPTVRQSADGPDTLVAMALRLMALDDPK